MKSHLKSEKLSDFAYFDVNDSVEIPDGSIVRITPWLIGIGVIYAKQYNDIWENNT